MSAASIHCPYCNAQFSSPNATPGVRVACPRCGERFAVRPQTSTAITANPDLGVSEAHSPTEAPVPPAPRLPVSNGLIALVLLGVMVVMAMVGGVYAWRTAGVRREYDAHIPRPSVIDIPLIARIALGVYVLAMVLAILRGWNRREKAGSGKMGLGQYGIPALALFVLLGVGLALLAIQQRPIRKPEPSLPTGPDAVAAVLPSQLAALGYVPDDSQFILGIHVAEAWRTPMGRPFLDGSQPGAGLGFEQIEAVTGLKLVDVDHAVLAVKLDKEKALPRVFLIVRTILPYDRTKIHEVLKPADRLSEDRREIGEIKITQWKTTAAMWFADNNTLVVAWPSEDIKEVPPKPKNGVLHLPHELQAILDRHLDQAAKTSPIQLWAAGHVDSWEELAVRPFLALSLAPDTWSMLSSIESVGVWAQLGEGANLEGLCECTDGNAADALRRFLQPGQGGKSLGDLLPQRDPLARQVTRELKAKVEGHRIKAQTKVTSWTPD